MSQDETAAASVAPQKSSGRAPDWNVVVTLPENTFREAFRLLRKWGTVRRTHFYNVLTLTVPDPRVFLASFEAALHEARGILNIVSRVIPADATIDFSTAEEFEARSRTIVLGWLEKLRGQSFHVRLHRRGFRDLISTPREERFLDDALLTALVGAGVPGSVRFEDPDAIIQIETVDRHAGIFVLDPRRSAALSVPGGAVIRASAPHLHAHRRMPALDVAALRRSTLFSEGLGIDLASGEESEWFRWLLASLLLGARIRGAIAANTYRAFLRRGLTAPQKIIEAGWSYLVNPIMRERGYVRYDGRKSDQVLRVCRTLVVQYGRRVSRLQDGVRSPQELEELLQSLYGVGPIAMNILLRELRPFWPDANPESLDHVKAFAAGDGIDLDRFRRKALNFAPIEAGLIRLGHRRWLTHARRRRRAAGVT